MALISFALQITIVISVSVIPLRKNSEEKGEINNVVDLVRDFQGILHLKYLL